MTGIRALPRRGFRSSGRRPRRGHRPWLEVLEDRTLLSVPPASYLSALYQDVLQRAPDPSGLAYWSNLLQHDTWATQVALAVINSGEYHTRFLDQAYATYLGRAVDPQGLLTFTSWLDSGVSQQQIDTQLLASPEYFARAGGTNSSYLDALYRDVLGRGVDPTGATALARHSLQVCPER